MLDLIPLPYRILAGLLIAFSLFAAGFGSGVKITKDHAAAQQLVAQIKAENIYRAEVARGNNLSAKLATAETAIQTKTIERIKYVKDVTTGKPCLSADAVSLLNGTDKPTLRETTGQPAPESPSAPGATDTDVETWGIQANGQYDTCAERLNALIDFEAGRH